MYRYLVVQTIFIDLAQRVVDREELFDRLEKCIFLLAHRANDPLCDVVSEAMEALVLCHYTKVMWNQWGWLTESMILLLIF